MFKTYKRIIELITNAYEGIQILSKRIDEIESKQNTLAISLAALIKNGVVLCHDCNRHYHLSAMVDLGRDKLICAECAQSNKTNFVS